MRSFPSPGGDLGACFPFFQDLCDEDPHRVDLVLQEGDVEAFKMFFSWLNTFVADLGERFDLGERSDDETLVKLGAFAHKYQVSRLFNQVTYRIKQNIQKASWTPCPKAMESIYDQIPSEKKLRILYTTGFIYHFRVGITGPQRPEWLRVITKYPKISQEFIQRFGQAEHFLEQVLRARPCQFHNHFGQTESNVKPRRCPYTMGVLKRVLRSKMKEEEGLEEEFTDEEDGIRIGGDDDIWNEDGFPGEKP